MRLENVSRTSMQFVGCVFGAVLSTLYPGIFKLTLILVKADATIYENAGTAFS